MKHEPELPGAQPVHVLPAAGVGGGLGGGVGRGWGQSFVPGGQIPDDFKG